MTEPSREYIFRQLRHGFTNKESYRSPKLPIISIGDILHSAKRQSDETYNCQIRGWRFLVSWSSQTHIASIFEYLSVETCCSHCFIWYLWYLYIWLILMRILAMLTYIEVRLLYQPFARRHVHCRLQFVQYNIYNFTLYTLPYTHHPMTLSTDIASCAQKRIQKNKNTVQ